MKKSSRISAKVTSEMLAATQAEAAKQDRTLSWLVCKFIEEGLQRAARKRKTRK
jgi:hypothetical protein